MHAEFYAWQVTRKLDRGRAHKSLGKRRINQDSILFAASEHDSASFAARGRSEFVELLGQGLRPHHKVVDYGCGSFRVDQHCIALLAPRNYVGMDVTDRFFLDGQEILGQGPIAAKRPQLFVIGDDTLAQVAAWQADFIFATGVTQHVPPTELDRYFDRLCRIKRPGTRLLIFFVAAGQQICLKGKSWAYEPSFLLAKLALRCPKAGLRVTRCAFDRKATKAGAWEAVIVAD